MAGRRVEVGGRVGLLQHRPLEALRGLDGAQAWRGRRSPRRRTAASTRLIVSTTGSPGTTAACPARTAATTAVTSSSGTSGRAASCTSTTSTSSGRAMQRAGDGVLTGVAAGHHDDLRREGLVGEHGGDALRGVLGGGDHDEVDGATGGERTHGVHAASGRRRGAAAPWERRARAARRARRPARGQPCGPRCRSDQSPPVPPCRGGVRARRRGPRRGWPRPCPRWSSRRGRARSPGSGGPWPACASRRPTGRARARGATGRGRPRRP